MSARFCRSLLLPFLLLPLAPPALAQRTAGPPTQDPFGKRETVAPAIAIGSYRSHRYADGTLTIRSTDGGTLRVRPWATGVVRVEYFPAGQPVRPDSSVSVVQEPAAPMPNTKLEPYLNNVQPDGSLVRNQAGALVWPLVAGGTIPGTIVVQKNPLRVSYQRGGETVVAESGGAFRQLPAGQVPAGGTGVAFRLQPDEHLYGTGSRALPLDRRGRRLSLYNEAHYSYQNGEPTLNVSLPTVVSSRGYMLFFDHHTAGTLDLGATDKSTLEYRGEGLTNLGYFIIVGNSYAEILSRYTALTGRQPLPPRWGLGLIQSRFGYKTEQEMYQVAGRMRRAGFPLDGLVLDLYWFGGTKKQGDFRWVPENFPDPKRMMRRLDSAGVKTLLISEPYVMRTSRNDALVRQQGLVGRDLTNTAPYTVESFWAGPATLLDMFRPKARQWMWQQYDRLKQDGVGGWWSDLGEPENQPADMRYDLGPTRRIHNAYGQAWASILSENYARSYPQERLFNLARSGWAGMQRHSIFPWSGDINRSWSGFQAQVPIMLGMGLGGVGYMHSDAGGFCVGPVDSELYTRWLQMASLCPIMRPHGEGVPPEPYWYPEPYQGIVREAARLRYQLLPYLYTLAWENNQTGTPLARPMNYGASYLRQASGEEAAAGLSPDNATTAEWGAADWSWNTTASSEWGRQRLAARQQQAFTQQNTAALANVNDQYLLGPNLLVAPVLQPGQRRRNVVLPAGPWIDFYTNQTLPGGRTVGVAAPLARIPLLVRGGAFLPLAPYVPTTARYRTDTLRVRYYADPAVPTSSFALYDDDGKSGLVAQTGLYQLLAFQGKTSATQTDIRVSVRGKAYPNAPAWRSIELLIPRVAAAPTAVLLDGETVPATEWQYEAATRQLRLRFLLESKPVTVSVQGLRLNTAPLRDIAPEAATLEAPDNRTFGGSTTLRYSLTTPGTYPIRIRNAAGTLVRTLTAAGPQPAGTHSLPWNGLDAAGRPLPGGVYWAEMNGQHQRLVLLREQN
ncbi:Alpha-glucosidase, glycosyl hydrolase family GH31 [Hymenobacter daecheongensis DSM 21074]|uniref:Alpha-glucosidase, glycosyl hydrolase family GH31 n=1 Tax=Hymenobacter daecheongensis DSM 21074 TaxID=1121955 RepID=A0A1M6C0R5_9BACT|nr:TIM-barrel domain-containing protein [Hymenobacter daecheongensis]SHI54570.1 Alpha-glucosidase, glycosyl hydrolase family GH31 [Hymenobacter daecheongensis DSM 21074]